MSAFSAVRKMGQGAACAINAAVACFVLLSGRPDSAPMGSKVEHALLLACAGALLAALTLWKERSLDTLERAMQAVFPLTCAAFLMALTQPWAARVAGIRYGVIDGIFAVDMFLFAFSAWRTRRV